MEIEFKAWDKVLNQFLPNVQNHIGNDGWGFGQLLKNDRYVICQFTGVFDKKGNKIFKGDIVTMQHGLYKYYVEFEKASFVLYHLDKKDHIMGGELYWGTINRSLHLGEDYELEVIGNIHEK